MKKLLLPIIVLAAVAFYQFGASRQTFSPSGPSAPGAAESSERLDNAALHRAIASRAEDVQIEATGEVIKLLPDDNQGSRHQRFLVRVGEGRTVLIAHNIDLAPRVDALREGDAVSFSGEYVWNEKGGVVHWTHHDPKARHVDGWIRHEGRTFQ